MMKKMLTDRRGVAIEMAILMTVICFAVSSIVLSTALLQHEKKVRAEERLEENIIFEQIVEQWLKDPDKQEAIVYKGYIGTGVTTDGKLSGFEIVKEDANDTPLLTITIDTDGKITGWKKG
jgi:hypothetical protein